MKRSLIKALQNTFFTAVAAGLFYGAVELSQEYHKQAKRETERQVSTAFDTIGRTAASIKGTNIEMSVESQQEFLDYIGIKYKLGTNEVIFLNPSMGNNWQDVYVGVRNKNTQGGGIIPGFTSIPDLQSYIISHQK